MYRCVNPDCGEFEEPMAKDRLNGGEGVTPCCRSIRWWDDKGNLCGNRIETLFCGICRTSVCHVPIEPFIKENRKVPVVYHEHCSENRQKYMSREAAIWLESAVNDIAGLSRMIAWNREDPDCQKVREVVDIPKLRQVFWEMIGYLADQHREKNVTDIGALTSSILLGKKGEFGIPPFDGRPPKKT